MDKLKGSGKNSRIVRKKIKLFIFKTQWTGSDQPQTVGSIKVMKKPVLMPLIVINKTDLTNVGGTRKYVHRSDVHVINLVLGPVLNL